MLGLARLSYDIRYLDFANEFNKMGSGLPHLSSFLWIFGPLDWWSFITPLALAVAASALPRTRLRPTMLALMVGAACLQAIVFIAAARPYFMVTAVMGYPIPEPYPGIPLLANLSLVGTSVGLTVFSVLNCIARSRASASPLAEEESTPKT